ncbi:MAG: class III lanthionine synthetase LanKC [Actinocatenispora sp.]
MWDTLNIYAQQDPRWFEPLARYAPDPDLLAVYRASVPDNWQLTRRGWWFMSRPDGAATEDQGWKLHVSSAPHQAADTLRAVLPVLFESGTMFKFLLDTRCVAATSGKRWPRGSSGKFVTVYPVTVDEFRSLAKQLAAALDQGVTGPAPAPFILSDRRVPDSTRVYYRYGGFASVPRLRPDGVMNLMIRDPAGVEIPDVRGSFYSAPDWAPDPFGHQDVDTEVPQLADGRFTITAALTYSNSGGVYKATDGQTGKTVVIKEARPGALVGRTNTDATEVLAREHLVLTTLTDVEHFVNPVDYFSEWEHVFLVEDYVDGKQMSQIGIATNPILTADCSEGSLRAYYRRHKAWWLALSDAIRTAHRRGVVLGDLSFTNVLVRESDDRLVLIDMEAATRVGVDTSLGLHTPGVSSPAARDTGEDDRAGDYYGLGALILGSVMLVNAAVSFDGRLLAGFTSSLADDLVLPEDLVTLVRDLMDVNADPDGPDPDLIHRRIEQLDVDGHVGWSTPVPLALPAAESAPRDRTEVARLIRSATDLIIASADTNRADRLFPGHFMQFETNPFSVAYGAAGVLHALHVIDGSVPDGFVAWLLAGDVTGECPPGLYTGTAGIAWVLDELGYPQVARHALARVMDHALFGAEPGVLMGTAGIGMACLRLWRRLGDPDMLAWAVRCGETLAATAVRDGRGPHWPVAGDVDPSEPGVPIGYARGASGIALFLLYLSVATGESSWRTLGRDALGYDLSHAHPIDGHAGTPMFDSFPAAAPVDDEPVTMVRSYWDEGSAGIATALLRYLAFDEDEYLSACWQRMRPDVCRKYAIMPQLFHGLAGMGMVLLDAVELIGDHQALAEAWRTADGVRLFASGTPDGTAFPGEQCLRQSTDLATGSAGVLLFLDRLGKVGDGTRTNPNFVLDELLDGQE